MGAEQGEMLEKGGVGGAGQLMACFLALVGEDLAAWRVLNP